jgi:DNA repair exonuclease SbcCD nuclease subunit
MEQIFRCAEARNLPVILAGDVFDSSLPDSMSVHKAVSLISGLYRRTNQKTYFIEGQHEMSHMPWLGIASGSVNLHRGSAEIGGRTFYGLSFTRKENIEEEFRHIPPTTDVLVAHQVWADIMGSVANPQASFADVPHVKAIITGDYHKHFSSVVDLPGRQARIVSPGSISLRSMSEDPNKYFFVMYEDLSVSSHPLVTRHFFYRQLMHPDQISLLVSELDAFLSLPRMELPEAIRKPIVCINHKTEIEVFSAVKSVVSDRAFLVLQPVKEKVEKEQEYFVGVNSVEAATLEALTQATAVGAVRDVCSDLVQAVFANRLDDAVSSVVDRLKGGPLNAAVKSFLP